MINWRIYQNYLLLFAIAFKTLILGTMLTLATHNICLGQLLNDDINWTQIVGKQRKRNDEPPQVTSFNYSATIPNADQWLKNNVILPVLFLAWMLCLSLFCAPVKRFVYPLAGYTPYKIFIRHRAIVI